MGVVRFSRIAAGVGFLFAAAAFHALAAGAQPSCNVPNAPARMLKPAAPVLPQAARDYGITGYVDVLVTLDERSHIVGVPVIQKSPSNLLSKPAIDAARATLYITQIVDCLPVAGKYTFTFEFRTPATPLPAITLAPYNP